ncbi:type I glutamate--ammonia ligase [Phycisphaera mikurensis]|uniref:Glutamine synthetase n=1 Tax=Phycisphaera mikurensis (strain NBRC 102666 / KCTC 22515 / FYK2301M01) TaxID=1142394 RepID=I0IBV9_PHYMF|nr:type I glutamate--ammonia ligase [Phycisphaera mikurensis]MBB6442027.1 glutamine synthetase [Phycisphaera mikurensis]BAM02747.1 glutamine synthetase I [Phycisphaera mikurensis NBRC 102666]
MTADEIAGHMKTGEFEFLDCRFLDFPGLWQNCTYTASEVDADRLAGGFGFDGSAIRGWQAINESDMLLVPDCDTARRDPFAERATLAVICDVRDPVTKKTYGRDPRAVAKKAQKHLEATGIADTAHFGPELEFFLFDRVRFDQTTNAAWYEVDSAEGVWNRGSDHPGNRGHQIPIRQGYFPCPPVDTMHDLRGEMAATMQSLGIRVECHHHEVATGGQQEIDLRFDALLPMADKCMFYKHVVKRVAANHGRVATFMAKPLLGDNGSGMHTHFSLWKDDEPVFAGRRYAGLSQLGLWAIGGILRHTPSLLAFCAPGTNSYKRLVPGFEAPVSLVYSSRNRSAAIRIPRYDDRPGSKRLEFRCPDPSANPYLAFSAILMAALDGIQNEIDPGDPVDLDLYDLEPERFAAIPRTPATLDEALSALDADRGYLLAGDVFPADLIDGWIAYKRQHEVDALRARPHPHEFEMYFHS